MSDKTSEPNTHIIHMEERTKTGARIYSPTGARNKGPITDVLASSFIANARILEIGSGTGEHAVSFCRARPDIVWQPSDPDAESRASIADWATDCPGQIAAPLNIDVTAPNWWDDVPDFSALYSANMIHIAPNASVAGLARGAKMTLSQGGQLILYGPFLDGDNSASSNLAFDERLRQRNSDWGVRSLDFVKDIFADHALEFSSKIDMPANNYVLIFVKA